MTYKISYKRSRFTNFIGVALCFHWFTIVHKTCKIHLAQTIELVLIFSTKLQANTGDSIFFLYVLLILKIVFFGD